MEKFIKTICRQVYMDLKIDADIVNLSNKYDKILYKSPYTPLYGISFEPGPICCNYCPNVNYKITKNDIISYTLGIKSKNNVLKTSRTRYFNKKNAVFNILTEAVNDACHEGIKVCGEDVRLITPMETISEVLESYDVKSINNLCGHNLNNLLKIVPNISPHPSMRQFCKGKMINEELYYIDVYATNLSKHTSAYDFNHPSIFCIPSLSSKRKRLDFNRKKRTLSKKIQRMTNYIYNTHRHNFISSRMILQNVRGSTPFHINTLIKHKMLNVLPTKFVKKREGCAVVHTGHTIKICSSGGSKILT
jgi:methionine aminopeptidase